MSKLKTLSETARTLANELFSTREEDETPCLRNDRQPGTCLTAEENRPLTTKEKRGGWSRRPFWAYDTEQMCNSCRAYWFAERAAQTLHEMHCNKVREDARKEVSHGAQG